jgi:hypothetical protein
MQEQMAVAEDRNAYINYKEKWEKIVRKNESEAEINLDQQKQDMYN